VRFGGPPGVHVAFSKGRPSLDEKPAPVTVGLRPGYVYRVRLSGFPGRPGLTLFPTLEVVGSLHLPPHQRAADYPAPAVLTEEDVERVLAGSLVTKVIYLEDPEKALAVAAEDLPELSVPPGEDPLAQARESGRPVLLLRVGQRQFTAEEMAREVVAGTVLLPGDKGLSLPHAPPAGDPTLGPRRHEEECLHDGGDRGWPAGVDGQGRLGGLDPSDTVAEYRDSCGRPHLAVSNRVCLCVPRFAVVKCELPLAAHDVVLGVSGATKVLAQAQAQLRQPSLLAQQVKEPDALVGRERPSAWVKLVGPQRVVRLDVLQAHEMVMAPALEICLKELHQLTEVQRTEFVKQQKYAAELTGKAGAVSHEVVSGTAVAGCLKGVGVIRAEAEVRDVTVCCNEPPKAPDKPLILYKWVDCQAAKVGDVVTFYLKYSNHGGQPITDVAVSDSLTARLEYVPGSAKSNRDAVFTLQENEAGSMVLRWEVTGKLLPGQSGVVSFQARIR
jgi:uncharacterized repeat protein (TIGR01451 family)